MKLSECLRIQRGITAIIGGGGKTTLMEKLGEELACSGRVILGTSTRIYPPQCCTTLLDPSVEEIAGALEREGLLCVASRGENGKLRPPRVPFAELAELADHVLVEADGSRGLPLKAHAPHEPAIPEGSCRTILVVGADGFGRPIVEVCHRPELYAGLLNCGRERIVTPEMAAEVICREGFGDLVFINKTESPQDWEQARRLEALLPCPTVAGSLQKEEYRCLY